MKYTLLELCQVVLSSMDSDEINSINDTVEAQQVAKIVRTAYFDIVSRAELTEHFDLRELEASGDNLKPTLMYVPETLRSIKWVKYNKIDPITLEPNFSLIKILPVFDFLNIVHSFKTNETNIGTFNIPTGTNDSIEIYYRKDKEPDFCMVHDDHAVIFDSYNSSVDTTLQKSKSLVYGEISPVFTMSDTFTPDLDEKQFSLLLNEVKVLAFAELKQTGHAVAASNARRQRVNMQKSKEVVPPSYFDRLPNYGRSGSGVSMRKRSTTW